MTVSLDKTSPFEIVAYEEDTNLRLVTWNQVFLDSVRDAHELAHKQAILFVNAAQDRFRLVACFYGLAVLVLPPTSSEERLSIYIKVGEFMRKLSSSKNKSTRSFIDAEVTHAQKRISLRNKLRSKQARVAQGKRKG